jgi:hypothetical protein
MTHGVLTLRRMPLLLVLALVLGSIVALRIQTSEAGACGDSTIGGSYGLRAHGAAVNPNGTHTELVFIGRTTYDGTGHLSGVERASVEGNVEPFERLTGTYHVPADCTGAETFTFADTGQVVHAAFVVVDQGSGILFLDTDPGTLLTVRAVRQ